MSSNFKFLLIWRHCEPCLVMEVAFIGGIGRLISYFAVGSPSTPLIVFTLLEVIGAPIFIYWQSRLAAQAP